VQLEDVALVGLREMRNNTLSFGITGVAEVLIVPPQPVNSTSQKPQEEADCILRMGLPGTTLSVSSWQKFCKLARITIEEMRKTGTPIGIDGKAKFYCGVLYVCGDGTKLYVAFVGVAVSKQTVLIAEAGLGGLLTEYGEYRILAAEEAARLEPQAAVE
jgi:hypothetical protein